METNKNNNSLKKLGKIEGVIYMEDDGVKESGTAAPLQNELPFPEAGLPPQTTGKPMYHKEPKQDILVHCPISLHRRLTAYKTKVYDESGDRVTINNMIVDAIASWLDEHENKVSATT